MPLVQLGFDVTELPEQSLYWNTMSQPPPPERIVAEQLFLMQLDELWASAQLKNVSANSTDSSILNLIWNLLLTVGK